MATGVTELLLLFALWFLFFNPCASAPRRKPNIIFIMADDLGYDDLEFQGHEIPTPNINYFRENGQFLQWYYAQTVCSPSRSSLMTGVYPMHNGVWDVITPQQSVSVPFEFKLLPKLLYENGGYDTHMVGKWHLGFYKWRATPTFRGFKSFFGYYSGAEGYYSHVNGYYDFHDARSMNCGQNCSTISTDAYQNYSTFLFTDRAIEIVKNHSVSNTSDPLFLYLAYQSVHNPEQVPQSYVDALNDTIANYTRRYFGGMLSCMDEGIGNLTKVLKEYGYLDENTIIIFSSDNGGPVPDDTGSSNYPLRGGKMSIFEGGVRVTAVFYATDDIFPLNNSQSVKNTTYTNLMHMSDWYNTLLTAADINVDSLMLNYSLDGNSQWQGLIANHSTNPDNAIDPFFEYRDSVYYGYDMSPKFKYDALRVGWYKIINGSGGYPTGWYPPPPQPYQPSPVANPSSHYITHASSNTDCDYDQTCCTCIENDFDNAYSYSYSSASASASASAYDGPFMLFNLSADPYEHENVVNESGYQAIFQHLLQSLKEIESTRRPEIQDDPNCPNATNPVYPVVGKVWLPWC